MLTNMAACPVVDQHCPCADMTWWNLMNKLFKLCLGNTKMFTSQKIGRTVFIYFYFDKILTHANAIDKMHVNARENELITFLPALFQFSTRLFCKRQHVRQAGLGSIQFRNWNCSSIPIPIPELELELKLVELKMELELKPVELELELKNGIEFFCNCYHSTY